MGQTEILSIEELKELESKPRTKHQKVIDYIICVLPALAGIGILCIYYLIPNYGLNTATNLYPSIIGILTSILTVIYILSFRSKKVFNFLRGKAPLYTVVLVIFLLYDYNTLKTGNLMMPYFPWIDKILNTIIDERMILLDSIKNSLILLFSGYFIGTIAGLITGIMAGWSPRINYWISPVIKILGPIPSITWISIVLIVANSLFTGSVFLIALGVWYPVTMSSFLGVTNIKKSFFEVARTLGASEHKLIFNVAIPSALPNIFQGLTQGMSIACTTLIVAEMMGVESGLGWYINWQRGWAEFAKMYSAVIAICLTFTLVNKILTLVKNKALSWQEGVTR